MATLEERLVEVLRTRAGLSALVGNRIFHVERPQGEALPAVVWMIDRKVANDLDGETGIVEASIEVEAHSLKRSTARLISAEVVAALYSLEASTDPIVQAVSVGTTDGENDGLEDGSGRLVRFETVSARAWVRE